MKSPVVVALLILVLAGLTLVGFVLFPSEHKGERLTINQLGLRTSSEAQLLTGNTAPGPLPAAQRQVAAPAKKTIPAPAATPAVSSGLVHVLAFALESPEDVTHNAILLGRDAVLILIPHEQKQLRDNRGTINEIYIFNNLSSLAQYDSDGDGFVHQADPVYSHLYLAILKPRQRQIHYVSLSKAGVNGILLQQGHLDTEVNGNGTSHLHTIAAKMIMADSSQRVIKVLPMEASLFQNVVIRPVHRK